MRDSRYRMGELLTGTCGYSYDDWKGPFYPDTISKNEYLHYYSMFFRFVELDFSYYAMPTARGLASIAERTPSDFRVALKAHKSLTHERLGDEELPSAIRAFSDALAPLESSGKLAAVLLQFPYSFHRTEENRLRLAKLCDELARLPLAVEFRNADWGAPKIAAELERRNIAPVLVDLPELPGLPPAAEPGRSTLAYVRFHGRNAETWWNGDSASRYDYRYSEGELRLWVPKLRDAMAKSDRVIAAFNNHRRGQAVENAKMLADLFK